MRLSLKNKTSRASNMRRSDSIAKVITGAFGILFWVLFIGVIAFIIYGSIPGWKAYKFADIFGTITYNLEQNKAGVWMPFCLTIMVSGLALLIAGPLGIKTATFIKFRIPTKTRKYVKMVVELLADFPAVVFGLFAITALGPVVQTIFRLPTMYNVVCTGIMQGFMIVPTVVSLTLSALDSVDNDFLNSPMVLGNTKTGAIYKVYKKNIRGKVVIALMTALARGLGETMAVSMILQSQNYNQVFGQGFISVWTSYLKTLGGIIASNMFAETSSAALKGLLYIYGIVLLIFVIVLNGLVKALFLRKKKTPSRVGRAIKHGLLFMPRQIKRLWNKILNKKNSEINEHNLNSLPSYFSKRAIPQSKQGKMYTGWKLFWETFCFAIVIGYAVWMFLHLIINGIGALTNPGFNSTIFQFGKNTTGQALVNTLLSMVISVGIGFIISLAVAIYLNEFAKEGKYKQSFIFFIDSLGATPTIIYGMFGLIFFLQILGLSSGGRSGKSLLAGSLTLIFVILPAFTRTLMQALQVVPNNVKQASYALGVGKWHTIKKLVLPAALQHILASVVLSIGRVLAETAPLYLTAGLGGGSRISYMSSGQTLTTRIYAQINSNNIVEARNIMYECTLVAIVLILIILILTNIIIPKIFEHKKKKVASIGININEPKKSFGQKTKEGMSRMINKMQMLYNLNIR